MKKLVIFTTTFVIFIVFIFPGFLALGIKIAPYNNQPGYNVDNRKSLFGHNFVTQKFQSQENNLTGIGISIGNPNLKNKKGILFNLYEGEALVRSTTLSGLNVPDGAFVRFLFAPIADSKGRDYEFRIESPQAGDEEVLYIYHTRDIQSWMGELEFSEEKIDGVLPFVTFHKPQSKLKLVGDIYSSWIKKMVGSN